MTVSTCTQLESYRPQAWHPFCRKGLVTTASHVVEPHLRTLCFTEVVRPSSDLSILAGLLSHLPSSYVLMSTMKQHLKINLTTPVKRVVNVKMAV